MFIVPVYYEIKRVSFAKVTLPYSYTMRTSVDASKESKAFVRDVTRDFFIKQPFVLIGISFLSICREVL